MLSTPLYLSYVHGLPKQISLFTKICKQAYGGAGGIRTHGTRRYN